MKQVAKPLGCKRDVSHRFMMVGLALVAGIVISPVFGESVPSTSAVGSPVAGTVTYLSIEADGSVWLQVIPTKAGKIALYRTTSGQQWERVLVNHGTINRLWFFGSGRVLAWLRDALGPGPGLIVRTVNGGVRWESLRYPALEANGYSNPGTNSTSLLSVSFVTPAEGWMLFQTDNYMQNQLNALYHTLDGGDHWAQIARAVPDQHTNGLSTEFKTGIEFRDARNGWMGTDRSGLFMPSLYTTRDGGGMWERVPLPPPAGAPDYSSGEVLPPRFFGSQSGVAVALLLRSGMSDIPFFYTTSDGGRTWDVARQSPVVRKMDGTDSLAWDVLSPAIWAVGSNQTIWLTSDAGRTWSHHSVPLPPTYKIVEVALAGPAHVWLVGMEASNCASFFRPFNSTGATVRLPFCMREMDRQVIADYVLKTPDAGLHWTRVALPQIQ